MFVAFVVALIMGASGPEAQVSASPEVYSSKAECQAANTKVEAMIKSQDPSKTGIVAYSFQCSEVKKEDFKKNGLDA